MERDIEIIESKPGLTREIGYYVAGLERVRESNVELITDMSRDELSFRFRPSFHQAGGLALHIGETEFHWIEVMAARKPLTDADRAFAHLDDTTENDFRLKGYTGADCVGVLQRIHERTLATLSGFADADLDELIVFDDRPSKFSASLRWILHHLIDHESHHKGQIALIKRLVREES